jgi:hypothetical protein
MGENQFDNLKLNPQALNVNANGVFMVTISLKSPFDASQVNPSTVRAYGAAPTDFQVVGNGSLHLKFNREDLRGVPVGDSIQFVVSGKYYDNTWFVGWDYIKVIDK